MHQHHHTAHSRFFRIFMSSRVMSFRRIAFSHSSSLVIRPKRSIRNVLLPASIIVLMTYRFIPSTMETTVITVVTPIITPRRVRKVRSLFARKVPKTSLRISRKPIVRQGVSPALLCFLLQVADLIPRSHHAIELHGSHVLQLQDHELPE